MRYLRLLALPFLLAFFLGVLCDSHANTSVTDEFNPEKNLRNLLASLQSINPAAADALSEFDTLPLSFKAEALRILFDALVGNDLAALEMSKRLPSSVATISSAPKASSSPKMVEQKAPHFVPHNLPHYNGLRKAIEGGRVFGVYSVEDPRPIIYHDGRPYRLTGIDKPA